MRWSLAALLIGFGLDLLLGDPRGVPHPVALIGKLISALERMLRRSFPQTAVEATDALAPADMSLLCNLLQRNRFSIMGMQKGQHPANPLVPRVRFHWMQFLLWQQAEQL